MQQGTTLRVANLPPYLTQEDFSRTFMQIDGCRVCRMMRENNESVGYVEFTNPKAAQNARAMYHGWQGWGARGLAVELVAFPQATDQQNRASVKRDREDVQAAQGQNYKQSRMADAMSGYGQTGVTAPGIGGGAGMGMAAGMGGAGGTGALPPGLGSSTGYSSYGSSVQQGVGTQAQPPSTPYNSSMAGMSGTGTGTGAQGVSIPGITGSGASNSTMQSNMQGGMQNMQSGMQGYGGMQSSYGNYNAQPPAQAPVPQPQPPPIPPSNGMMNNANNMAGMNQSNMTGGYGGGYQTPNAGGNQMGMMSNNSNMGGGYGTGMGPQPPAMPPPSGMANQGNMMGGGGNMMGNNMMGGGNGMMGQAGNMMGQPGNMMGQGNMMGGNMMGMQPGMNPMAMQQGMMGAQGVNPMAMQQGMGMMAGQGGMMNAMNPMMGQGGMMGMDAMMGQQLGPEAHHVVYVQNLPLDISKREVAHIFRPLPGYKFTRLIIKDSVKEAGKKICMAFVEYETPFHATNAMNMLNGYLLDLDVEESETTKLVLSYARPQKHHDSRSSGTGRQSGNVQNRNKQSQKS